MKKEYFISELAEKAKVTKRTIHYYVNKGLLKPPEGSGLSSRYTDEHYFRLLYIKKLKAEYFPLSKIKEILEDIDLKEVERRINPPEVPRFMRSTNNTDSENILLQNEDDDILSMNRRRDLLFSQSQDINNIMAPKYRRRKKTEELVRVRFQENIELTFPKQIENKNSTKKIIKMIHRELNEKE